MSDLRALLAYAAPHRAVLGLCVLLMLCDSAAALLIPWLGGRLAGVMLEAQSAGLSAVLTGMLCLFALQALLKFGNTYLLGSFADRMVADLKARLYDHLQALPLAYYQERRLGDSVALLTSDVYVLTGFISEILLALLPLAVTASGAAILMFRIQPALALLVVILVPLFYLLLKIAGRRLRPLAEQLQHEYATAIAIAQENLGLLPAIKTFTRERQESARFREQIEKTFRLGVRERRIYAALEPAAQFVAAAGIVLVLALAGADLADGNLSPPELVSFLLYAALLTRPVAAFADVYGRTQMTCGAFSRLQRAMDEPPEPPPQAGMELPAVKGDIEFRGVSFAYGGGRPPALNAIDLRIAAGQTVAIVGANGAGKSTLGHLLMRLHQPAAGKILIDGTDIAAVSLHSLRRQIGVVPQHVLLFNASVRDNIAYGRIGPSQAQIEVAAAAAQAHDFIMALPQGYDTPIGDRGVRLSGGQQQRVALARALLKDPPILILDEATSLFDPEGEAEYLRACRDARGRRTVLLITHRPASLAAADRIVRMESGRVIAS